MTLCCCFFLQMHLMNIPAWNNNTDEAVCIAGRKYVEICLVLVEFFLFRVKIRFNC